MAIAQVNHSLIADSIKSEIANSIRFLNASNLISDCFVATCNPDKMTTTDNITQICQPNANVGQIKTKIEHLRGCIDECDKKKGDVCKQCAQNHTQLENHLEQLMSLGAGVCFEIIDVVTIVVHF